MKRIVFLCIENSCRSQMAEAIARQVGGGRFEVASAGSRPSGQVEPMVFDVLKEKGIPVEDQFSKGIEDLPHLLWDVVVSMGCGDNCPTLIGRRHVDWNIENPRGKDVDFFRRVRDEIEEKVRGLLQEVDTSYHEQARVF